jgi:hypothetical protein
VARTYVGVGKHGIAVSSGCQDAEERAEGGGLLMTTASQCSINTWQTETASRDDSSLDGKDI